MTEEQYKAAALIRQPAPAEVDHVSNRERAKEIVQAAIEADGEDSGPLIDLITEELDRRLALPAPAEITTRDLDRIEAFLGEAENYELADDSTVDITEPFDALERIRALVSHLALPAVGWRPTHRHYKGGLYREIARGRIEADLSPVVVYDNEKGETWVRPVDNFDARIGMNHIPRFEMLPTPIPEEPSR